MSPNPIGKTKITNTNSDAARFAIYSPGWQAIPFYWKRVRTSITLMAESGLRFELFGMTTIWELGSQADDFHSHLFEGFQTDVHHGPSGFCEHLIGPLHFLLHLLRVHVRAPGVFA